MKCKRCGLNEIEKDYNFCMNCLVEEEQEEAEEECQAERRAEAKSLCLCADCFSPNPDEIEGDRSDYLRQLRKDGEEI